MVGCGLEGHSRERARAHAHTHTLLCHLRQQRRRRRRPHVASFAVATEAWSYKRRRPRQRGGEGRGSNRATSTRRFFPHANGNDRDVCPFGCVIRASQRISPVAGVAPANRRSDKSTDGRTDGRTQRIEQRRRSERLPSCGLVVGVVESDRARSHQLLHRCLPQSNVRSGSRRSSPRAPSSRASWGRTTRARSGASVTHRASAAAVEPIPSRDSSSFRRSSVSLSSSHRKYV